MPQATLVGLVLLMAAREWGSKAWTRVVGSSSLTQTIRALRHLFSVLHVVSLSDLMRVLAFPLKRREGIRYFTGKIDRKVHNLPQLRFWFAMCQLAGASYTDGKPEQLMARGQSPANLVAFVGTESSKSVPFAVLRHGTDSLVFAIRGTASLSELSIDSQVQPKYLESGVIHSGIHRSARILLQEIINLKPAFARALEKTRRVIFVGHSLGAAVACVVANQPETQEVFGEDCEIEVAGVCCPRFVSKEVAAEWAVQPQILLNGDDMVPRIDALSLRQFFQAMKTDSPQQSSLLSRVRRMLDINIASKAQEDFAEVTTRYVVPGRLTQLVRYKPLPDSEPTRRLVARSLTRQRDREELMQIHNSRSMLSDHNLPRLRDALADIIFKATE